MQLPAMGMVVEIAEVGGLHHRYERRADIRSVCVGRGTNDAR